MKDQEWIRRLTISRKERPRMNQTQESNHVCLIQRTTAAVSPTPLLPFPVVYTPRGEIFVTYLRANESYTCECRLGGGGAYILAVFKLFLCSKCICVLYSTKLLLE